MARSFLLFRGQKPTLLDALRKLNEISVITVALYVLLSFQGIPLNCPTSQYQSCYHNLYTIAGPGGENGNFFQMGIVPCGVARRQCLDALAERYTGKWLPLAPELVALNPAYYQFCFCIIKMNSWDEVETLTHVANSTNISARVKFVNLTQANVKINSEPGRTCDNSLVLVSLVVFFTALFLVLVGEIILPRLVSIVTLLICAGAFYAGTLGSLYVAASACPGAQYLETVDTVRNLIIACAAMLLIVAIFDTFILCQRRHDNKARLGRSCIQYEDEDDLSNVAGAGTVPPRNSVSAIQMSSMQNP